jgi:hypothetical protein
MRIQLILALIFLTTNVYSADDKSMQELFKKYDSVMDQKKVELIEETFTAKFIKDSGGKDQLVEKIKELNAPKENDKAKTKMSWKKGLKGEIYFAKVKKISGKDKKKKDHETEFLVLKENGKLKIDGTISDGD